MVQLHQNLQELEGLDVETYIVSNDTPEQQLELYKALEEKFGESLPLVSDSELTLTEHMKMKNGDVAFRGYGMMDQDGRVVFQTKNDHWGEEFEQTMAEIREEYNNLTGSGE